jgi:hypothetical protein
MKEFYQVQVTQEVPFMDYDEDGEESMESSGHTESYIAGTFRAEHNARLFKEALERKIAEGAGYIVNHFTPRVSVIRVSRTEEVLER